MATHPLFFKTKRNSTFYLSMYFLGLDIGSSTIKVAPVEMASGVVYAVSASLQTKELLQINDFAYVNHPSSLPSIGKLLNINSPGIFLHRLRGIIAEISDEKMHKMTSQAPVGSEGISIFPFGNGAEPILENGDIDFQVQGVKYNTHRGASHNMLLQDEK